MNLKNRIRAARRVLFSSQWANKFNQAFFSFLGGGYTSYDDNAQTYISKGFNTNPFVYSVVNQIATKVSSIPFHIKKVEDPTSKKQINNLIKATNYNLSGLQQIKLKELKTKAYKEGFLDIPLERPNPLQTWQEFMELYEVFMKVVGNVYIYLLSPEFGTNKGEPSAWYLLPSHLTQIVLKENTSLHGIDSPVDHYIMTQGNQYVEFKAKNIVHIKYANPNYDQNGSHLYGAAPMRSVLKNIQSSNEALSLNVQTMKNGGAYGFFYADSATPLTEPQAAAFKQKLDEMAASPDKLSKIAASSIKMGFQRMSLTADELKPFDYLSFDLKQICNALGWDDKLLNSDAGAKFDNYTEAPKIALIRSVVPDLKLFEEAVNNEILPRYKGYKGSEWCFDISELPEMQTDMNSLVEWTTKLKDKALMTGNQALGAIGLPESDNPLMDKLTTNEDLMTLEQSLEDFPTVE